MDEIRDLREPESEAVSASGVSHPPVEGETSLDAQEDFVHESVELPGWVPIAFGIVLIAIAAAAIWMAV